MGNRASLLCCNNNNNNKAIAKKILTIKTPGRMEIKHQIMDTTKKVVKVKEKDNCNPKKYLISPLLCGQEQSLDSPTMILSIVTLFYASP
eukprot:2871066-Ditylum_brightwellii.AAC.1